MSSRSDADEVAAEEEAEAADAAATGDGHLPAVRDWVWRMGDAVKPRCADLPKPLRLWAVALLLLLLLALLQRALLLLPVEAQVDTAGRRDAAWQPPMWRAADVGQLAWRPEVEGRTAPSQAEWRPALLAVESAWVGADNAAALGAGTVRPGVAQTLEITREPRPACDTGLLLPTPSRDLPIVICRNVCKESLGAAGAACVACVGLFAYI